MNNDSQEVEVNEREADDGKTVDVILALIFNKVKLTLSFICSEVARQFRHFQREKPTPTLKPPS